MRDLTTHSQIVEFMRLFGRAAHAPVRVYLTGGSTAVLQGWRETTVDIDLRFTPESDELFRSISKIKEQLNINLELAAPSDFIPELPGWEERSIFVAQEGKARFFQYDPYSQALAKIERGHNQDLLDVKSMFDSKLIEASRLLEFYDAIEPLIFKYPAINPEIFRSKVIAFIQTIA
ncbi:MAG: hypothetical protein JNL64_04960 [Blastocatellia bacterium]|nr:hypothetical protein [Blastocatellia bacterium]